MQQGGGRKGILFAAKLFERCIGFCLECKLLGVLITENEELGDLLVVEKNHVVCAKVTFWEKYAGIIPDCIGAACAALCHADYHNFFSAFVEKYNRTDRKQSVVIHNLILR